MFGDYFTTRKRLTDVVVRVLALAEKTGCGENTFGGK